MVFKVAVSSTDGKVINQHFGRSKEFLIFDLENDSFVYSESRSNTPPCGSEPGHDNQMLKTAELLSDCKVVLVSQIGPAAIAALNSKGVQAFVAPNYIEDELKKLASSYLVKNYIKDRSAENG